MVSPQEWARFARLGSPRVYGCGQILLRQGETMDQILILLGGRVKVSLVDPDGNALLLAIRGPGEVLGEIALLDGAARSATVTAIDPCEVRAVAAEPFLSLLREMGLEGELVRCAVRRFRQSEEVRLELATMSASERVVRGLLRLAVPGSPDTSSIDIGLDQTEFGQAVGLSRGSVADKLAELRVEGLISTHRGRIIVNDLDRLRKLTGR
jgi:CRP/FNR family transcriptional regulator, cyclic AMP receptor protein